MTDFLADVAGAVIEAFVGVTVVVFLVTLAAFLVLIGPLILVAVLASVP